MARVILPLLVIGVVVYSLVDCIQTDEDRIPHLPKLIWIALIVLAPPFGALAWLIIGRRRPASRRPAGPRGPDDDPDFLRGL